MSALSTSISEFTQHAAKNSRRLLNFITILVTAIFVGTALPLLLISGAQHVESINELYSLIGIQAPGLLVLLFPSAMVAVTLSCLTFEAIGLGYYRSTLFQVIEGNNASVRNDVFYLFLRVTGLASVLAFIMTLGTSLHFLAMTSAGLDQNLIAGTNPIIQFVVLALSITLLNYWTHRAMHTKWFFEIHKVHHSAEHFGVLLPFRAHPLDHFVAKAYTAGILAFFGIDPVVLIAWMALNAFYQSMVHSKLDWPGWMEYIVVTPALHRIHHSTNPRHYNKNLSILTIWDKLFGTYHAPDHVEGYGLDGEDKENFNTGNYIAEIFLCFTRWIDFRRRA